MPKYLNAKTQNNRMIISDDISNLVIVSIDTITAINTRKSGRT